MHSLIWDNDYCMGTSGDRATPFLDEQPSKFEFGNHNFVLTDEPWKRSMDDGSAVLRDKLLLNVAALSKERGGGECFKLLCP